MLHSTTALGLLQNWERNATNQQENERRFEKLRTAFMGDLAEVRSLNFEGNTDERASQGILGGCEQHLVLDLSVVR